MDGFDLNPRWTRFVRLAIFYDGLFAIFPIEVILLGASFGEPRFAVLLVISGPVLLFPWALGLATAYFPVGYRLSESGLTLDYSHHVGIDGLVEIPWSCVVRTGESTTSRKKMWVLGLYIPHKGTKPVVVGVDSRPSYDRRGRFAMIVVEDSRWPFVKSHLPPWFVDGKLVPYPLPVPRP